MNKKRNAAEMLAELKSLGLRQIVIAEKLGVSQAFVSYLKNGVPPSDEMEAKINKLYSEVTSGKRKPKKSA